MELAEKRSVSAGVWASLFLGVLAADLIARPLLRPLGAVPPLLDLLALSSSQFFGLIALAAAVKKLGISPLAALRNYAENIGKDIRGAALITAVYAIVATIMIKLGIQGSFSPGSDGLLHDLSATLGQGFAGKAAIYFCFCLLTPIFEEIFFRRFLYVTLRHHYSTPRAIFIAAVIFALVHLHAILLAFIAGAAYCYVYERYKRLNIVVLAHIMTNFLVVTFSFFGW